MQYQYASSVSWQKRCAAWLVHIFTASGAILGLFALLAIYHQQLMVAFWLMLAAVLVDAIDGSLARRINVKQVIPEMDGALLDNIVDFLNYVIVPAFFILVTPLAPDGWRAVAMIAIVLSSAYQFCQIDAKTADHFFKGFPSYWNIVVFYLFFCQMNPWINFGILIILAIFSFVPIKYVYPSRLDYLTHNKFLQRVAFVASYVFVVATAGLMWFYPKTNDVLVSISMGYMILYILVSFYRTWVPLSPKNQYE